MVNLREYARGKRSKEKTDILTARLPVSKIRRFKTLCDELGLSVSEAIQIMIDEQLGSETIQEVETSIQKNTFSNTKEDEKNTVSDTLDNKQKKSVYKPVAKRVYNRKSPSGGKRFTTNRWKVDGKIPCPLCGEWEIFKNYKRHTKKNHNGESSAEVFTNEENAKIADEMVRQRKEEMGLH